VPASPPEPDRIAHRYHHGDLENTLIRLALAQIERSGSVEFTLRGLARDAGVSHVAVYRHFADKTTLLARIAELGFVDLVGILRAEAQDQPPVEVFTRQGLAYVRFALDHPGHFRVMWHHALADRSAFPPLLAASRAAYQAIRGTVESLHGQGLTRSGHDVDQLTTFAWASMHGIACLLSEGVVAGGEVADRNEAAARVAELTRMAVLA